MMAKDRITVKGVQALYAEPKATQEVVLAYLSQLHTNYSASEKSLSRRYWTMLWSFFVFLMLDTGLIQHLSFQGTEITRTEYVMLCAPLLIAVLYLRATMLLEFISQLRGVITEIYRNEHAGFYDHALDTLTAYPSTRNTQTIEGIIGFNRITRPVASVASLGVFLFYWLAPIAGLAYCLFRLWHYPELPRFAWFGAMTLCAGIVGRALLFGQGGWRRTDPFSTRIRKAVAHNNANAADAKSRAAD